MRRPIEDEVGSFLARWSRRKAAARRGIALPDAPAGEPSPDPAGVPAGATPASGPGSAPAPEPRAAQGEPATRPAEPAEEPGFDLASLPDPDTLDAASDFTPFMRPGVPAELKRRALRRLWKVNPIISTPDGLDDYYVVNDFSDASTVVADLKTLYRVGRGMVAAFEEEEKEEAEGAPRAAGAASGERAAEARSGSAVAAAANAEPPSLPAPGDEPGLATAAVPPADPVGSRDPLPQGPAGSRTSSIPERPSGGHRPGG